MDKLNITVIGAGVVGLAVANELSKDYKDIVIVEKNDSFGRETSSRNSEVIHAGIYYPQGSLKAKACVKGNKLLYDYCGINNIGNKRIGKLIVAVSKDEVGALEVLWANGVKNGVEGLRILTKQELKEMEPAVKAETALYSPSTGVVDSHGLMKKLAWDFKSRGGEIIYNTEAVAIANKNRVFKVSVKDSREGDFDFLSRIVINSAGLYSDRVSEAAGLKKAEYKLKYCKGDYFRVHNNKAGFISRLIYPVPLENRAGLGVHATLDLSGGLRLGPDEEYIDKICYDIALSKRNSFYESVRKFLPFIKLEDLGPDTAGIRAKLQGPGEGFKDFMIKDEAQAGLPGFINLIGIESPGLTSSLYIALEIKNIISKYF